MHSAPNEAAVKRNEMLEPEGERLRAELIEWLRVNQIVGICMDTPEHVVRVDSALLPPRIKPVLTFYGSIYVKDEEQRPEQRGPEGKAER